MTRKVRIGIVICDRYRTCAGGKCLRAMRSREGAFSRYAGTELELVGYTSCGGCPGGNIEHTGEEMMKNGVDVIHLATGMIVGYPPCPYLNTFRPFLQRHYGVQVVVGTHPIPEKYLATHTALGTWADAAWAPLLEPTMADEAARKNYD
jgi:predicted metal-binding protein